MGEPAAIQEREEARLYATRVTVRIYRPGEEVRDAERLVIVPALSAAHARRESALVEADFHEATPLELAEWEDIVGLELAPGDVRQLERMVRGELVQLGNRRLRDQGFGLEGERQDRNLGMAVKLVTLRGRLASWLAELEDDSIRQQEAM